MRRTGELFPASSICQTRTEVSGVTTAVTKRQQRGEGSREVILDATERLMVTRGYAATSISDIRRTCERTPGQKRNWKQPRD